jgi:hypothetical protein
MRKGATVAAVIIMVSALILCLGTTELRADETQRGDRSYLLDRGTTATVTEGRPPAPTSLLWVGNGTPTATPNTFFVPTGAMAGKYFGNQFIPGGTPPSSFPTSWGTFSVIAAFGYQYATAMVPAAILGEVFGPMGPVGSAMGLPMTVSGPSGGLLTAMFSPMALVVFSGQSFVIGVPGAPMAPMQGIGGVTLPPTGMSLPLLMFSPMMMGLPIPVAAPAADWIAGARVTGANVPVELQAFHVE